MVAVHMPKVTCEVWQGRGCSPIDHRQDSPMDVLQHCLSLLWALLQQTTEGDCLRRLQRKGPGATPSRYTGPTHYIDRWLAPPTLK